MPVPIALAGAAIGAAGGMQSNAMNMAATSMENYVNRRWQKQMYQRQYNDNIAFWRMQNDYNTPAAQMQRFRDAGLNPNLVYGQGNAGNAGSIAAPDTNQVSYVAPRFDNNSNMLPIINAFYDLDIKQAQIDNLRAQNSVIKQDALLKAALTGSTDITAQRKRFDLGVETELKDVSMDARRERLRQLKVTTDIAEQENVRREILTAKNVQEAAERILNMRVQRENMKLEGPRIKADTQRIKADTDRLKATYNNLVKDGTLKELDIELRRLGLNPNDPTWMQVVGRVLNRAYDAGTFELDSGSLWDTIFSNMFN